jgi:hypothetical protein
MKRARLNVFLEPKHARSLVDASRVNGVSQSSLVAAALASFLSPDAADRREAAIIKRLDRLSHQYERIERDQTIHIETLALFVRYFLSVTAPLPESQQDAARAAGRARFEKFIEQLAAHLQRGHSLVRDVHEQVYPEAREFFGPQAQPASPRSNEEMP